MNFLGLYVMVGIPAIAMLMGFGAVWLVRSDYRKLDAREKAAKQPGT